jgi:hypothetical protein
MDLEPMKPSIGNTSARQDSGGPLSVLHLNARRLVYHRRVYRCGYSVATTPQDYFRPIYISGSDYALRWQMPMMDLPIKKMEDIDPSGFLTLSHTIDRVRLELYRLATMFLSSKRLQPWC